MQVNTKSFATMTQANQNFSKITHLVDENGSAIIFKNNVPRYFVAPFEAIEENSNTDAIEISKAIITKHKRAFEELAQ